MDDLAAFITARLDEEAAEASLIGGGGFPAPKWTTEPSRSGSWVVLRETDDATPIGYISVGRNEHEHITRHDPARALREVAAKRIIVRGITAALPLLPYGDPAYQDALLHILRTMAAVWSDHPDYRAEWAAA